MQKHKTAVLISGNGSNLQALIDAAKDPAYPAEIALVISNREDAYGLERARNAGIPSVVLNHMEYSSREEFDQAIDAGLQLYHIEYVCLAGFMRLLSAPFVSKWHGRMLNIHPSLLPAFKGGHAVRDALAAGVSESGCTVHLVTEEMDAGEIVAQATVPVLSGDNAETLHDRIHAEEHKLYPHSLKLLILRNN